MHFDCEKEWWTRQNNLDFWLGKPVADFCLDLHDGKLTIDMTETSPQKFQQPLLYLSNEWLSYDTNVLIFYLLGIK